MNMEVVIKIGGSRFFARYV